MMNSKKTKRALLSSVLALLLCFAMLLGTTFAWFTDNASTTVNKIESGTLDVLLQMKKDGQWVKAEGELLSFTSNKWEPGCTYSLPELRIVNNGNLALKYKVEITGIKGDAILNRVIDWTMSGVVLGHEYQLEAGETHDFTISGHMQESAGNEYQNKEIDSIAITVYATQATVEVDGTGKNTYDKNATYDDGKTSTPSTDNKIKTLNALKEAITSGATTIELGANIELDGLLTFGNGVTIYGNGHTLTNASIRVGSGSTIKNVVFDNAVNANNEASSVYGSGSLTVENCTFKNFQWDAIQATPTAGDTVTINGCSFTANSSGAERFIHVEVNDSTCATKVTVNITNNSFGSSASLTQDVIGIYGIDESGINYGGNNSFADTNGVIWIGWRPNLYADKQSEVYGKLTGSK